MISHRRRCIFIHIPKTAGSSIEKLIWSRKEKTPENLWQGFVDKYHNKYQTDALQHLLAAQVRQEVGERVFDDYFKFTFVRNPWDKAVSEYEYIKRRPDMLEYSGMKSDADFKSFLELITKVDHVHWQKQYRFFQDEDGGQIVDYIGRFESLEDDLMEVLKTLRMDKRFFGLKQRKIPHKNKGSRGPYQDYYDEESRQMVAEIYQKDIELLKYEF